MTTPELRAARIGFAALAVFWFWLALAAAPPAAFTIDDFFYIAAARRLWDGGGLFFDNGFAELGSDDLKLWFFVEGPGGLTPQYPVGFAILAAPFEGALGVRGFFALNTLAALGMVWATWRLARAALGDARDATIAAGLLAGASFLPEYANGIWPHAAGGLMVTLTALLYFAAERETGRARALRAAGAGLVGALALTIRLDSALIAPGLLVWTILCAGRPASLIGWGALGAAPGLALGAAANLARFGTLNPLSYGLGRDGGVELAAYAAPAALLAGGLALAVALRAAAERDRAAPGRPAGRRAAILAAAAAAATAAAAIAFEPAREALAVLAQGARAILYDLQAYSNAGKVTSIEPDGAGYWLFIGHYKKALLQSLPWLALAVAAAPALLRPGPMRKGLALCALTLGVWSLPFVWREWHGGLANNMRYFTPVLPMAAILGAAGWRATARMAQGAGRAARLVPAALVAALILGSLQWAKGRGLPIGPYMMLSLSKQVAAALALSCAAALAAPALGAPGLRPAAATAGRMLGAIAIALAFATAHLYDLRTNFARRDVHLKMTGLYEDLPGDSTLVTLVPQAFVDYFFRPDTIVTLNRRDRLAFDPAPIIDRLKKGGRVFVSSELARDTALAADPRLRASAPIKAVEEGYEMYELTLAPPDPGA